MQRKNKRLVVSHMNGFTLIEILLVLTVSLSLMILKFKELNHDFLSNQATIAGEQIKTIGNAVNNYIVANYSNLAKLKSSKFCVCSGDSCTITPQTLINSGLLPFSFRGINVFNSTYSIQLKRTGASPNYTINGLVLANKPFTDNGKVRFDLLGDAMRSAGSDSGICKNNTSISGYSGIWAENKKDYSIINKTGQLAYRVGFNSGMYTVYLRRDGTLPMTGDLNLDNHNINNVANINAIGTVNSNSVNATGKINAGSIKSTGDIDGAKIHSTGTISAGGEVSASNAYGDAITLGGDAWGNDYEIRLDKAKPLSIFSPKASNYTTVLSIGKGNAQFSQRLGLMGTDPNSIPAGWNGGLTTLDIYANGTIGLGVGGSLSSYMNSSGDIFASNNITSNSIISNHIKSNGEMQSNSMTSNYIHSNGSLDTGGRISSGEYVQINGIAREGASCSPNGLLGRDTDGKILSCQSGKWSQQSGVGKIHKFEKAWGKLGRFSHCSLTGFAPSINAARETNCYLSVTSDNVWSLSARNASCGVICF